MRKRWYLSFADDDGFRGGCTAFGDDMLQAVRDAAMHACNPGGDVWGVPIPFDPPPGWQDRHLYSKAEMAMFGGAGRWPDDPGLPGEESM